MGQEQAHGWVPLCRSPSTVVPALGRILAALCVRKLLALALRSRELDLGAGKRPSSWIPISKASPMLLDGVLLKGSLPSSSGSTGKNAALNNQSHAPLKEQEGNPNTSLPLFRTQKAAQKCRLLLVTAFLLTDAAAQTTAAQGVSQSPLHLQDAFSLTFTSHTSQKTQTKTTHPEYLSHAEKDI